MWNHRQQEKYYLCLLRAVRLYAAPSVRKSGCEWRYKGLAGEVLKRISWGLFGVCCFAFPAFTVSPSKAAQFSLGIVPFYLQSSNWLAPPTSQTLAHLHTPPYDPEIVSGKNMRSKQAREPMPRLCCTCQEKGAYFLLKLLRYKSRKRGWHLPCSFRKPNKGRQILNSEEIK